MQDRGSIKCQFHASSEVRSLEGIRVTNSTVEKALENGNSTDSQSPQTERRRTHGGAVRNNRNEDEDADENYGFVVLTGSRIANTGVSQWELVVFAEIRVLNITSPEQHKRRRPRRGCSR